MRNRGGHTFLPFSPLWDTRRANNASGDADRVRLNRCAAVRAQPPDSSSQLKTGPILYERQRASPPRKLIRGRCFAVFCHARSPFVQVLLLLHQQSLRSSRPIRSDAVLSLVGLFVSNGFENSQCVVTSALLEQFRFSNRSSPAICFRSRTRRLSPKAPLKSALRRFESIESVKEL